jgi:glycine/D-amino acid oxidase-like deaminating enzyme
MSSVTVVGAGVFGAATARELALRGWDVTLVEQYTPGNVRSGSGGDTRLSRAAHGGVEWYTRLSRRARTIWLELQEETGTRIWEPVGVAWFALRPDGFEQQSRATLEAAGVPYEWLAPDDATSTRRSGPATCTRCCSSRRRGHACAPCDQLLVEDGERRGVRLEDGRVFPATSSRPTSSWACGSWLPRFPRSRPRIAPRVFFFGTDASGAAPGFCGTTDRFWPRRDHFRLGAKIAPDLPGERSTRTHPRRAVARARAGGPQKPPALALACSGGRWPCLPVRPDGGHALRSTATRSASRGGCSAEGHGFKHGPALAAVRRRRLRGRVSPSRSTHSARAPATPACAPPPSADGL